MARGGTPRPVQMPPADAFDEVTNGIGAVIDVEQRRLRPLEEHGLPGGHGLVQEKRRVGHPRPQPLAVRHQVLEHRLPVERGVLDRVVPGVDVLAHFGGEGVALAKEVADADAAAANLVFVGRTDAA